MANKSNSKSVRMGISLPRVTAERLDRYATQLGVSRSSYIALVIGQSLTQMDTVNAKLAEVISKAVTERASGQLDEE